MHYLRALAPFLAAAAPAAALRPAAAREVLDLFDDAGTQSQKLSTEEYLAGCTNGDYPTIDDSAGEMPLHQPPQVVAGRDGVVRHVLYYDLAYWKGPSFDTIVRVYNSQIPGPTLRVKPGQTLEITLVNCLEDPPGFDGPAAHNTYKTPNVTNLHLHGPHVSGMHPGDNVLVRIDPRSVHHYSYAIDANHMPGTFWYHPHSHGATALQTSQGAAGMLIVDYPEEYPHPPHIKEMPEIQLVIEHFDLAILRDTSTQGQDRVTDWRTFNFEVTNATTTLDNFLLINGQFVPKITMEVGVWYRWKTLLSSVQMSAAFESQSKDCEFHLLSKDGIFLKDAPRAVPVIMQSPGNRADIAVRCNQVGQERMNVTNIPMQFVFDSGDQPRTQAADDPLIPDLVGNFTDPALQPVILLVDVVNPHAEADLAPLPLTPTMTPCYLVDLNNARVDAELAQNEPAYFQNRYNCNNVDCNNAAYADICPGNDVGIRPYPEGQNVCYMYGPYGVGGDTMKPRPFEGGDVFMKRYDVGTVNEIELQMARSHPYHQHVNPYQINAINGNALDDEGEQTNTFPGDPTNNPLEEESVRIWYQVGDWQDTLQMPTTQTAASWRIRFQTDQFTGHMIQHCHILFHEDKGMMSQYEIVGQEGTAWPTARAMNPQCLGPGEGFGPKPKSKKGKTKSGSKSEKKSAKNY